MRKEEHTDMHRGVVCVDRYIGVKLHMCMLTCIFMCVGACLTLHITVSTCQEGKGCTPDKCG